MEFQRKIVKNDLAVDQRNPKADTNLSGVTNVYLEKMVVGDPSVEGLEFIWLIWIFVVWSFVSKKKLPGCLISLRRQS